MSERTVNINNFIGIYDGYITEEECNNAIKLYENEDKFNKTLNRIGGENASILSKQDQQYFAASHNITVWWETLKTMILNYDQAWKHYIKNTGASEAFGQDEFYYTTLKIQKTLPPKDIMFACRTWKRI